MIQHHARPMRDSRAEPIDASAWGCAPLAGDAGWRFSIWSPHSQCVALRFRDAAPIALTRQGDGFWTLSLPDADATPYRFIIDGHALPDPASRDMTGGVHGWSVPFDPASLAIRPGPKRDWAETVIYELHIGTFTPKGTFAAAQTRLAELADLGFTAVEVMPVAPFAGQRGWGYDGVQPYAVHDAYGSPQDFAAFIDHAHRLGLMVILDVVYNHFGPSGAVMHQIAPSFFIEGKNSPWGPAIDYTQTPVRRFFLDAAMMWLRDYRIDGLRLDAVHEIRDPTDPDLVAELRQRIAQELPGRLVPLIAEDERNDPRARERGSVTAEWNDDWHHSVHCLLTGEDAGYYQNYAQDPLGDLATAMAQGHVDQGQVRADGTARGKPSGHLPPTAFVNANQTHDQIGNRAFGERLITLAGVEAARIVHAMLLCSPYIPMLFMGEEAGCRQPFLFFADHDGDLAQQVRDGRMAEFAAFGFGDDVPDPNDPQTHEDSILRDPPDATEWRELTRRCLAWRSAHVVPLLQGGQTARANVIQHAPCGIEAEWVFPKGRLHLFASLGAKATPTQSRFDWTLNRPGEDAFSFGVDCST